MGTWQSFIHSIANHSNLIKLRRSQNLTKLPVGRKAPNRGNIHYNKTLKKYCIIFPGPDGAVVSSGITLLVVCVYMYFYMRVGMYYKCLHNL